MFLGGEDGGEPSNVSNAKASDSTPVELWQKRVSIRQQCECTVYRISLSELNVG